MTEIKIMKKLLLFLALASLAAFAETVVLDISQSPITFTSEGVSGKSPEGEDVEGSYDSYIIEGDPYYSDYVIKVLSGTHNITIRNVNITYPNTSPFDMSPGASVTLTLSGQNTFYMPYEKEGSPVHVPEGASLTIQGEGSLTAHAMESSYGAGIGSVRGENSGVITITSGTILAYGDYYSAGIGGGYEGRGTVIITGGDIKAQALGCGAGIGGGGNAGGGSGDYRGGSCNVTISGGRIKAKSDSGAGIGHAWFSSNDPSGTVTITGGTIEAESREGAGIGAGGLGLGPNIYISGGSVKAKSTGGGDSVGKGASSSCPDPLTSVGGEQVYLAIVREAFDDQGNSYLFTMKRDYREYPYAYSGSGYTADGDYDLYFYLPGSGSEYDVEGSNGRMFRGEIMYGEGELILTYAEHLTLNISDGPIGFDIDQNETYQYRDPDDPDDKTFICDSGEYIITGTYDQDDYDQRPRFGIKVTSISNDTYKKITLSNCYISAESAFCLEEEAVLELVLKGDNTLRSSANAGLFVNSGSRLTICSESTGSLSAFGGKDGNRAGAGIGGYSDEPTGVVTINGGTITAEGAQGAAGIGGGTWSWAPYLTINGGNISAVGHHGAGIGGGQDNTCEITITGGNIVASSDDGAGIGYGKGATYDEGMVKITGGTIKATSTYGSGIGGGKESTVPDIYISGGSVWASSTNGSPIDQALTRPGGEAIYQATLQNAMGAPAISGYHIMGVSDEVTFTTKKDGSAYDYTYTGTGYSGSDDLYFYLPDGSYVIEGSNGRSTGGTISGGAATFVVVPEPALFGLLSLVALCFRRK
jgi:hypothetical protein